MGNNKVIVITLNYNQNEFTLKCVESLLGSGYENFKILLIDNGSEEKNFRDLRRRLFSDERIILKRLEKNRGYVGGINYGLKEGLEFRPDYFLIMNNDTIMDKNAIGELVSTAEKYDKKVIVTGKVYYYDNPKVLQDVGYNVKNEKRLLYERLGRKEIDRGQFDVEAERDMADDIFWLIPRRLYEEIGGYSPYFWFNAEQIDFALRAKKAGYRIIYTPKARIWHKGSVSIGGRNLNPKLEYWDMQSLLILKYIHLDHWNFFKYFLRTAGNTFRMSIMSFIFTLKRDKHLVKYALAKRMAVLYFMKWLFKRNENTGEIPPAILN